MTPSFNRSPGDALGFASHRLDVMGGIAVFGGSSCLEWLLSPAVYCHARAPHAGTAASGAFSIRLSPIRLTGAPDEVLTVDLAGADLPGLQLAGLKSLLKQCRPHGERPNASREWLSSAAACVLALYRSHGAGFQAGAVLELVFEPLLRAAADPLSPVCLATLSALDQLFGLSLGAQKVARLASEVAGALDLRALDGTRLTASNLGACLGHPHSLLKVTGQLCEAGESVVPPPGVSFYAILSGARHDADGTALRFAYTSACMGRLIVSALAPEAMRGEDGQLYLANLGSDAWRAIRSQIPTALTGAGFLEQYGPLPEPAAEVDPRAVYPIRLATEHPIYEAERVERFEALLCAAAQNPNCRLEFLGAAGDLMIQSHFSYDHRWRLGSPETDLLVELVREGGATRGFYGARVTDEGKGGTVAIMVDEERNPAAAAELETLLGTYQERTGLEAHLLTEPPGRR